MPANERVRPTVGVAPEAGPAVLVGAVHHAGADGIRLDIAAALEEVTLRVDQRRAVASFPQRARAPVSLVEIADVVAPQRMHHPGWRRGLACGDEQMHVV